MKKKSIFGCLAIICLLLVLIPPVLTRAEKHSLITWEKKSKNVVSMYLELQEKEAFEEIKAFSLTLNFDSKEDLSEEPVFKFGSDFKGEKVSVHEERYNEEDQTMKLYVAGRDTVLEKGEKVLLGTITIKSDENVTISVDENNFQIVDRFHEKGMITEFGDFEPYEMILKKEEETTVPETTVPETTVPETTDPETMIPPSYEDSEDEEEVYEYEVQPQKEEAPEPNGQWMQNEKGWWFAPLDGTYPADSWYECSSNGFKAWYYFNAEGYMNSGWFTDRDGNTYFLHDQNDSRAGSMYTGWNWINGKCYYFQDTLAPNRPVGSMIKNGMTPDGYMVNENGEWIIDGNVQVKQ